LFPENEIESVVDTHTTANWKDIMNKIIQTIGKEGHVVLEPTACKLICTLKVASHDMNQNPQLIKFQVQIFKSREYTSSKSNEDNENGHNSNDVYVVRMHRIEGDLAEYRKIKKYIFDTCADVLTGLPAWAMKLQEQKFNEPEKLNDVNDDYDDMLKDGLGFDNGSN